jgi:Protein of unknown function (DUF2442)
LGTLAIEKTPLATAVTFTADEMHVALADGRRVSVPLAWFPRLANAKPDELAGFELLGSGEGIHWPKLDEDLSVAGLLQP